MSTIFDGSTTWLTKSGILTGVADSKLGTFSCWFKRDSSGVADVLLTGTTALANPEIIIYITANDLPSIVARSASSAVILNATDVATSTVTDTDWHHLVASWDLGNSLYYLYLDRTDISGTPTIVDDTIGYSDSTTWWIGQNGFGAGVFDGEIEDLIFWPGIYVDLTDADELRKFVSSDGLTDYANPGPTTGTVKPVGYGHDGSDPTGTRPSIYFSAAFPINRGSGGPFTRIGSLDVGRGPQAYRQASRYPTPGERWFDSERSGFSYPRSRTFIEWREGHPGFGQRLGIDERDVKTRDERPSHTFSRLIFGPEDDAADDRRGRGRGSR